MPVNPEAYCSCGRGGAGSICGRGGAGGITEGIGFAVGGGGHAIAVGINGVG